MRNLKDYVVIYEMKRDMDGSESLCLVVGSPAAGKTTWMINNVNSFFGNGQIDYSTLDSDHTLQKFQKDHCFEIADMIYDLLHDEEEIKAEDFKMIIDYFQERSNTITDMSDSPRTELNIIKKEDIEKNIDKTQTDFETWFYNKYFKKIFLSDFEYFGDAKNAHNEKEYKKIGDSSKTTVVAMTGKKLSDYEDKVGKNTANKKIYVVYLCMPLDYCIENDRLRDRSVGEKLIRDKYEQIDEAFNNLVEKFEEMGIWKLIKMKPKFYEKQLMKPIKGSKNMKFKKEMYPTWEWHPEKVWVNKSIAKGEKSSKK